VSDPADNPITPGINKLLRRKASQIVRQARLPGQDREDLTQDLIVELLKRLQKYDSVKAKGNHGKFVKMIARRATINLLRRFSAVKRSAHSTSSMNDMAIELELISGDAEREELTRDVTDALTVLPADLQQVALLLMTESIAEIARILGVSRDTVYARVRKIRTHLQNGTNW
jgi:RNA polymerase sigma factor (sigma-70 family)